MRNTNKPTARSIQARMTEMALELAQSFQTKLDFTHESIQEVERILGLISEDYRQTKNTEGLSGIALEFAAYIVTTMERNGAQGSWDRDDPNTGQESFPYTLPDGQTIFPMGWCMKRILDGSGDSVWSKYQVLVLNQQTPRASGELRED